MKTNRSSVGLFPTENRREREVKTIVTEVNKDLNDSLNEFMRTEYKNMEKELLGNGYKREEVAKILDEIKLQAHAVLIQQLNQKVRELKQPRQPRAAGTLLGDKNKSVSSVQVATVAKR